MTLKEYIATVLLETTELKQGPLPVDVNFDIAVMPKSGFVDGKIESIIIVDESPSQYSSRIKLTITVH